MKPLQIWLPTINQSLSAPATASRDMQRAVQAWGGQPTIWLLPEIEVQYCWQQSPLSWDWVLAIPAEQVECIHVYHVNPQGQIGGVQERERFPGGCGEGLLKRWLNSCGKDGGSRWELSPSTVPLIVPRVTGQTVTYVEAHLPCEVGSFFPFAEDGSGSESEGTAVGLWPMERGLAPIAPDAESYARYGPFIRHEVDGIPLATSAQQPEMTALPVVLKWPAPLHTLVGLLDGADSRFHWWQMWNIARDDGNDREETVRKARNAAGPYVTTGWCNRAFTEVFPLPDEQPRIKEGHPAWWTQMAACHSITRAWGAVGLFWALLLKQLEQGRRFAVCEDCHQLKPEKRGKRFCSLDDDPGCFTRRRARDKRQERARRRRTM